MVISPLWLFLFRVVSRQDGNCIKCPSTSPVPFGEVDPLIIDANSRINLVFKSQVPTKYTNQPIKWMCFKAQHSKIFLCPILSTIFPSPKSHPTSTKPIAAHPAMPSDAMAHVAGLALLNDPIFRGKVHLHQCVGHLLLFFGQQRI